MRSSPSATRPSPPTSCSAARPRPRRSTSSPASCLVLVLEATRRTVGWILPAIVPRLHRLRLPRRADPGCARHRPQGLRRRPPRRPVLHGPRGPVRDPARRRGDLHRAVHALRRGARVLRRRALLRAALLRGVRIERHRAGPDDDARRLPARHRVGLRRRDDGHARSVTWPLLRRAGYPANEGGGMLAPRASARSCRRRRSARPRSSSPSSWRRATSRSSSTRSSRRSCTTSGSCWRSRPTRGASRSRARPRHAWLLEAARPLGLPLLVADRDRRAARDGLLAVPGGAVRDGRWRSCSRSLTGATGWGRARSSRRS